MNWVREVKGDPEGEARHEHKTGGGKSGASVS